MAIRPAVSYTPYYKPSREKTGDIIMFTQFEQGNLLSKTHEDSEINNESDDDSTIPPLSSKEERDVMDSGENSDDEPMSTEML